MDTGHCFLEDKCTRCISLASHWRTKGAKRLVFPQVSFSSLEPSFWEKKSGGEYLPYLLLRSKVAELAAALWPWSL